MLYMDVIDRITEILTSIAEKKNTIIVDVTYKKEGRTMVLRVLMDKKGGITIDECAEINNDLSVILDEEGIIDDHYVLEVSSPGLDRLLRKPKDFHWAVGKPIKATTYAPIEGNNVFRGRLLGIDESNIVVESEDGLKSEIPLDKIAKAKVDIDLKGKRGYNK